MPSLRCSQCGTCWPNKMDDFRECPECEKRSWYCSSDPIDAAEAHTRLCWARFDRFVQKRDADVLRELERIPTLQDEEPVSSD
jgi:predicted  nucleic acid-binding Zn-ribbon protein